MWLLLLLTTLFAGFSQAMMSYLVMHWSLGPWVGPIFVIVCMALAIPFVSREWFKDHAIVTIAAGSIGGMIGMSLAMTIPSFYFLYKAEFLTWLSNPVLFSGAISLLVFSAGSFAFLIMYLIKDHLVNRKSLSFPIAKLVYDIVSLDRYAPEHRLMWIGVSISTIWNCLLFAARFALQIFILKLQELPLLISIGFIAGHLITIPAIIGLMNRLFVISFLKTYFFVEIPEKEVLIMFCLGILTVQIFNAFFQFVLSLVYRGSDADMEQILSYLKVRLMDKFATVLIIILVNGLIFYLLGLSIFQLAFLFMIVFLIGLNVAKIVGQIGIIGFDGFVWCILLPLLYGTMISEINLLLVATFATVCLGMVIDLIFSYKLTQLSGVSDQRILKYQLIGFFVAAITSGAVMWYYAQSFDEQSLYLFAGDAQDLDALINYGLFNYKIFIFGILSGLVILFARQSLLSVVGMILMNPHVTIWLIITGSASFLVKDRQKLYPLWFGVYAMDTVLMILWAFL